jgi:hypothetical protein
MGELLGQMESIDSSESCQSDLMLSECNGPFVKEPLVSESRWDQEYKNTEIKGTYKVVFMMNEGGEENYAEQFKFSAEKIGWEMKIYMRDTNPFYQEILDFDPDFMLFTHLATRYNIHDQVLAHQSKKYFLTFAVIEALMHWFITSEDIAGHTVGHQIRQCLSLDGTIGLSKDLEVYKKISAKMNKTFFAIDTLPFTPALIKNL